MAKRAMPLFVRNARTQPRKRSTHAINAIIVRRRQLVEEVVSLREIGREPTFLANAQQLLTRWWIGASWSAREDLLKTAEWLVRLSRRGAPNSQSECEARLYANLDG